MRYELWIMSYELCYGEFWDWVKIKARNSNYRVWKKKNQTSFVSEISFTVISSGSSFIRFNLQCMNSWYS